MKVIFTEEVNNNDELNKLLKEKNIKLPDFRTAVIALFVDKDDNIILQRRGVKSRDEHHKLEDIGGACEEGDKTFKDALKREILEEAGEEIDYDIADFIGAVLIRKYDIRSSDYVNWLFMLYKCIYKSGEFKIAEKDKCEGYEKYKYEDIPRDQTAKSTLFFWDYYMKGR